MKISPQMKSATMLVVTVMEARVKVREKLHHNLQHQWAIKAIAPLNPICNNATAALREAMFQANPDYRSVDTTYTQAILPLKKKVNADINELIKTQAHAVGISYTAYDHSLDFIWTDPRSRATQKNVKGGV